MFLCISIFPGRRDEFAGQCREQMVYSLFDPPPSGDEPLLSGARGAEKHVSFLCGFWNPFLYVSPLYEAAPWGSSPVPLYVWIFGSNWHLEGENLGYTYIQLFGTCFDSKGFRKKSWLAFFPSIWSPIVSNFSNTLNIDLVIPAHCVHMEFHSVCVSVCVNWG